MRKFKILLPSIALLVVLAFSITAGVYAASTATFSISSSISFKSPDLDGIVIEGYIGQNISGDANFTYDASTNDNLLNVAKWEFKEEDNSALSFTRDKVGDDYKPTYLTFVIKSTVAIPTYAYFIDNVTDRNLMETDKLTSPTQKETVEGEEVPLTLVNVSFLDDTVSYEDGIDITNNDSISEIDAKRGEEQYTSAIITIKFDLIPEITTINDNVTFNYTLVVDKRLPELATPQE